VARLGLEIGGEAIALIKASWVILSSNDDLRCSARNQFRGLVQSVREGPINTEVGLALASGRILTAVITHESADDMELSRGQMITALIKASHVILAVDD
jgi:molybdate transport system regulatory protein